MLLLTIATVLGLRRNSALECVDTLGLAEGRMHTKGSPARRRTNNPTKQAAKKMTDDDGDDDTMEGRLAHILESDAMDTVDLWLTIVACLAAIETLYVCALATYRYSRRIYHLPLQRWTIRVLLVGPVYSVLMWVALWYPSLDFYLAVPLGFYECYAFFGFYAMLACFADGEDRLATALGSLNPGPPTAYLYHPFGFNWCSCRCDNYSPLFWGNIHYAALPLKFGSSRELLRFLKRGVAQAMIVKPCSLLLMLTLEYLGYEELCNATRLLSVVSFWCVANSITQLYHAVLPRIRGLGGERLVVLLLVMVSVLAIQDVVISIFLIQEEAITAPTDALPTRLVVILTILEFTAFSTIFYRLLPPEKFRTFARRSGASPEQSPSHQSMSLMKFVGVVLDPSTMFRINRGRFVSAYEGAASDTFDDLAHLSHLGVAEAKQDESSALVPEKW
jgi:hypothetical protein